MADASANLKRACVEYEAQSRNLRAARAQYDLAQARLRDGIKDRREIVAERVATFSNPALRSARWKATGSSPPSTCIKRLAAAMPVVRRPTRRSQRPKPTP